jgi:predicted RNase H-like nuclease (RuvC/YqgF family)
MAKRRTARATRRAPQRKTVRRKRVEESLLQRSAESLGRVIGTLQRQLEEVRKRTRTGARVKKSARARKGTARKKKPRA